MVAEMDRREFLITTALMGSGAAASMVWPAAEAQAQTPTAISPVNPRPWLPPVEGGVEINPWVVIGPDNSVTIAVNQSEMGQGVLTSNPMMICEELECDWSKVRAVYGDVNRHFRQNRLYTRFNTDASSSVRLGRVLYQQAGANARERLKAAAARRWNVPATEITTADGVLTHAPTGRTLAYSEVAQQAASITLDKEPEIKKPDQFKLIGRRVRRLDVEIKARGQAVYGIDIRLPDMVYAAVKMSPSYGGTLKSYDFDAIKNRPGVIVAVPMAGIGLASGVAVVADSWWRAKTAIDAMPIEWDAGPNAGQGSKELFDSYFAKLDAKGPLPVDEGDADAAFSSAAKVIEADYRAPHQAHATMEPPNCTARVTADKVEVWFGTQQPDVALQQASKLTGVPASNIFVYNAFQGGGFGVGGRRGELQQAVVIAKALAGRPVKVVWTREQDLGHLNFYHPMGTGRVKAALDKDGMPTAIHLRVAANDPIEYVGAKPTIYGPHKAPVAGQLLRGFQMLPYHFPNRKVETNTMKTWVPAGTWRATGTVSNVFYLESFIDELAHAAGKDPVAYRRMLIEASPPDSFEDNSKADWLRVLDTAVEVSGWGKTLPRGRGMGFAIDDRKAHTPRGIVIAAVVATVSVSNDGKVTIDRIDIVHEAGHALINPEAVDRQLRGMVAWSLGAVLHQEITFKNATVEQSNFHDYPQIRFADFPTDISVTYVRTNRWIAGVGEEIVPLFAPAIYNAIQAAIGKRVRSIPLRHHDLTWS
jgi:isoquinoline 1-oxidoreductase beta subunit